VGTLAFTFGAAFLGSAVESVEALTIVLAVGLTRGWRSPLYGTVGAIAILVVLVATLGQLIVHVVPEQTLKLVIGTLILLFGLRWLHKAVLRSAGVIALHDETEEFEETLGSLRGGTDWLGFVIAFKGVFLEGLEVAFIVFAVGISGQRLEFAALGGVLAILVVAGAGAVIRRPLARVPENTLKYTVGILLSTLGTFWAGEGMGVAWPLDIASVLVIGAFYLVLSQVAVALNRRLRLQAAAA
jgi:uncharacterized membrane protein